MQDYTSEVTRLRAELATVELAARDAALATETDRVRRLLAVPAPGWVAALLGTGDDPLSEQEAALLRVVTGDVLPSMPRMTMLGIAYDAARVAPALPKDRTGYPAAWLRKLARCGDPGTILGTVRFLDAAPMVKTMTRGEHKGESVALDKRKAFHLDLARQCVKWLSSPALPSGDVKGGGDYASPLSFRQRKYCPAFRSTEGALPWAYDAVRDVFATAKTPAPVLVPPDSPDLDDEVDAAVVATPDPPDCDADADDFCAWVMAGNGGQDAFQF